MPRPSAALALGLMTAAILIAPRPTAAQLSPGPLAEPHAHLEGLGKCLECHGVGAESVDVDCLKCHQEIAYLVENRRGFHGLDGRSGCGRCHPDHGGRDFRLIEWPDGGPESFDHRRAGWALEGKHLELDCRKCHRAELRTSAVVELRRDGIGEDSWLGLPTECRSCHDDPHKDRFGNDCRSCHGPTNWKEIRESTFDHDRTRYHLAGAHRDVKCAKCHDPENAWGPRPAFEKCGSCHGDAHAGKATLAGAVVDCDACHSERWFRPSTFTAARHQESSFRLEGKHSPAKCEACHAKSEGREAERSLGRARIDLRPASANCSDCHEDVHAGQLAKGKHGGECSACHDINGFSPSLFTIADHRDLPFPLLGRHEEAACRACHGPERKLLPPLPGKKILGPAMVAFQPPAGVCVDCHRDPHGGRFEPDGDRPRSKGCITCHEHDSFRRSAIDVEGHRDSRFPLEGAHRAIPCFECHKELSRPISSSTLRGAMVDHVLEFAIEDRSCAACHTDPHGEQFANRADGGDCSGCHGIDVFVPALRFDHVRDAAFVLDGAHAKVACDKCHVPGRLPSGKTGTIWRPLPHRCEDCHAIVPPDATGKGTR